MAAATAAIAGAVAVAGLPAADVTAPATRAADSPTTGTASATAARQRSTAPTSGPPSTTAKPSASPTPSATAPGTTPTRDGSRSGQPRVASSAPRATTRPPATVGPVKVDPSMLFTTGPFRSRVAGSAVDGNSAAYISRLSGINLVVSLRQWTVAVYGAAPNTPLTDVALNDTWGTGLTSLDGVPMPAGARPDPAGDGHLSVVHPSSGCVYDLFRARAADGSWTASTGNALGEGSTGIYAGGGGTRAAGFSAALGLIWPQEIESGHIDHALVFAYPYTRSGAPVAPATRSDGRTTTAGALPMGARLRLDPTLDLSTLGLNRAERVIAKALQDYGMVLGDTSGGFTLYAAHPRGLGYDPYAKLFGTTSDWASLAKIPKGRFQVLSLPGPDSGAGSSSTCAHLR